MTNPAGTRFESRLARYLVERGFKNAERRARSGSKDKGDIAGLPDICIEAKAVKRLALSAWMTEAVIERDNAGARLTYVIFPRRNCHIGRAFVVCELDQWIDTQLERDAQAREP